MTRMRGQGDTRWRCDIRAVLEHRPRDGRKVAVIPAPSPHSEPQPQMVTTSSTSSCAKVIWNSGAGWPCTVMYWLSPLFTPDKKLSLSDLSGATSTGWSVPSSSSSGKSPSDPFIEAISKYLSAALLGYWICGLCDHCSFSRAARLSGTGAAGGWAAAEPAPQLQSALKRWGSGLPCRGSGYEISEGLCDMDHPWQGLSYLSWGQPWGNMQQSWYMGWLGALEHSTPCLTGRWSLDTWSP